ncbi:MAG: tetratricopeptide repeat protein [Oceanipulchritudo sp.]
MKKQHSKFLTLVISLVLGGTVLAQTYPLSENSWDNPEFVKRFLGSYGIDSRTEPQISQTESELFQSLVELIQTDIGRAITTLNASITPESSPALLYTLGNLHLENGDAASARRAYERAIKAFPRFKRAYKNLAVTLIQMDDYKGAIPHLLKAIELGEGDGITYGLLAYSYLTEENFPLALEAYRMATLLDPDNNDWRIGKVQALFENRQYEEAITLLGDLLVEMPERQNLWITRANAFLEVEKPMDAAIQLEILKRMNRSTVPSLTLLGDIYMNENLPDLALAAYKQALEKRDKLDPKLVVRVAQTLSSRAALEQAGEYVRLVRRNFSEDQLRDEGIVLDLLNIEAEVAMGMNDMDTAVGMLESILDEDPMNSRALRLLANYHYSREEYEESEYYLTRLSNIPASRAEALVQLARLKVATFKLKEAIEYLEEAQMLQPDPNVLRYLEAVRKAAESYAL